MTTQKFNIIRLADSSSKFETGADILVLKNWTALSFYAALRLCELAKLKFGGEWVPAYNGADTVTVWLDFNAAEFAPVKAPSLAARKLPRKVA